MNEFSVKIERLILGKFAKGSEHDIVAVITCALRAQGPQFDPGKKHAFVVLFTEKEKSKIPQGTELVLHQASFCSLA